MQIVQQSAQYTYRVMLNKSGCTQPYSRKCNTIWIHEINKRTDFCVYVFKSQFIDKNRNIVMPFSKMSTHTQISNLFHCFRMRLCIWTFFRISIHPVKTETEHHNSKNPHPLKYILYIKRNVWIFMMNKIGWFTLQSWL